MRSSLITLNCLAVGVLACASGARNTAVGVAPLDPRCEALSDTLSKYVSSDALPVAHVVGNPALPRTPAIATGDSVSVEFVVQPNGAADTTSVSVYGATDPAFARSVEAFAAKNRFEPAQFDGCPVLSRYSVVLKAGASAAR
jgi:hypothetical protein